MPSAVVTFNGRVTLPINVRKGLGLKTGDNIEFVEIEKGRYAILPGTGDVSNPEGWMPDLHCEVSEDETEEVLQ
jgi:AbrB family looped-hinge helix DNA binding protein